jgi:23S rRNA (adenine2030-N6)-methyltransferase
MLSYQHAYHAGGAADLHKHACLAVLLDLLARKPRGISYLESHAGRALYDLAGAEAAKTGEAAEGIGRLDPASLPEPLRGILGAVRAAHGGSVYPGSPAIAATLLRAQDRIALCERHPAERAALAAAVAALRRPDGPAAAVHDRDGHEGMRALTPPKPRRGLLLIDPSYEVKSEYDETAETARAVLGRWPEGVVAVWYPLLPDRRHERMAAILAGTPGALRREARFRRPPARGMTGSGLVVLNAPYGTADRIDAAIAALDAVMTSG